MIKHISLRLAWHDDGWNGHVCREPKKNTYCVGQQSYPGDLISNARNLDWEQRKDVAGCHCSAIDGIPPCSYSINAFGIKAVRGESNPPDFFKDDSKGIEFEIPAATACIWPYEQMYSDDIKAGPGSSQTYDYAKRLQAAKDFFKEVSPDQSLIFYYANKSNPFSEEDSRNFVLVGISKVKKVGDVMYYENVSEANRKKYADGFVWQLPITSHFPDEGFAIPYHKYRDNPEVLERITYIPEIADNFKYGTKHISDDDALIYVERLTEIVGYLEQIDDSEKWSERKKWLLGLQNELWKNRGAYPGLNSALEVLEMPEFMAYYKDSVVEGNDIEAKETIFKFLNDKSLKGFPCDKVSDSELRKYQKNWFIKIESDDKRKLIENILSRIDLKPGQIKLILSEKRDENGLRVIPKEIIDNPFLLQEEFVGEDITDIINFEKIDHAVLPSQELGIDEIVPKDDSRRLRGLMVDVLKKEGVHSFIDQESVLDVLNRKLANYPDWKKVEFNKGYIDFDKKLFEQKIVFRVAEGITYCYHKEVYDQERLVEKHLRNLVGRGDVETSRPFGEEKWVNEVLKPDCSLNLKSPEEYRKAIDGQVMVCQQIFTKPLAILSGAAGTGKTTVIKAILKAIQFSSNNTEKCLLLAPTGKASDRMRESTQGSGVDTMTIHQFLAQRGWLNPNFTMKRSVGKRETEVTTYIIDETSMIDLQLMATLFRAINWDHAKRLIFVGDPNQLPPIGKGKVFKETIEFVKSAEPEAYGLLEHNMRQMENRIDDKGTGIIDLASLYAQPDDSDHFEVKSDVEVVLNRLNEDGELDKDVKVEVWDDEDSLEQRLIEAIKSDMEESGSKNIMDYQVISPYRGELFGTTRLNEVLQESLNEQNVRKGRLATVTYFDKVIQFTNRAGRNSYWGYNFQSGKNERVAIYNGEMGQVWIDNRDIKRYRFINNVQRFTVKFNRQDNYSISFSSDKQVEENIELGYAISVHKAQGSEFKYLYLIIPQSKQTLLSTELIYTGITRASIKLRLFVEKDLSVLQSLRRPERSNLKFINSSLFGFEPLPLEFSNMGSWYEEGKIHKTLSEYMVRSKSEVIIANLLVSNEIESFKYEKILYAPDKTFYLPDFTINVNGKTYYWEHVGMLDKPKYKQRWEQKVVWYDKHFPGKLLTTYEGGGLTLDAQKIIDRIKIE